MSILNLYIDPNGDRALIGTDSEGVDLGPVWKRVRYSKVLTLPALNAVLALRGHALFLMQVFIHCQGTCAESFDALLDTIPAALPNMFENVDRARVALKLVDSSPLVEEQLFFVGWSDLRQRIVGRSFCQETREEGFLAEDIETIIVAPWDESAPLPDISSPLLMEALIRSQVRLLHDKCPDAAAGGRLILCSVTKDVTTITMGSAL